MSRSPTPPTQLTLPAASPGIHRWAELGFGVQKNATPDANSRCIFEILTALRYAR